MSWAYKDTFAFWSWSIWATPKSQGHLGLTSQEQERAWPTLVFVIGEHELGSVLGQVKGQCNTDR